ncbi:MAG: hypothetical protein GJ680_01300 [Alteromonadaceae bacterium]|nr:hypothetical protein [Alteromonadaceae bacterium]
MHLLNAPLLNHADRLRKLRILAMGFSLLLIVPLGILLFLGYQQLERNAIAIYKKEANALIINANRKFYKRLTLSNNLPTTAFDYYQPSYDPLTQQTEQVLSPLSSLDIQQLGETRNIAGLVGYFQFTSDGQFNSPVYQLPVGSDDEKMTESSQSVQENLNRLAERKNLAVNIYQILSRSKAISELVKRDLTSKEKLFDVIFDIPEYFVFYRVISLGQQRRLQGYLVERTPYMQRAFLGMLERRRFDSSVLVKLRDTENPGYAEHFLYENAPNGQANISLKAQGFEPWQQQVVSSNKLASPFRSYRVTVSTSKIPITETKLYASVFGSLLIVVVLAACYGFYRLGVRQLALAEQRMNFVSAVSHELKTPLTAIRMYAEMLQQGTVISKQHQQDYFSSIFSESERLTRLINNVLQLSNLNNHRQIATAEYTKMPVLQDIIRSKTSTIMDAHDFQQNIIVDVPNPQSIAVLVEQDAFSQIVINITDNAIKFFDKNQTKESYRQRIDFTFSLSSKNEQRLQLEIRDYGEGIESGLETKIFELFYRGGDELTRSTQGTGMGLALVHELVKAQQGSIQAVRKNPGLALLISFKCKIESDAE